MAFPQFTPVQRLQILGQVREYERYLPTAYDDSLSLLEKINKIVLNLNEVCLITNDLVDNWNKLYEWIVKEGLIDTVTSVLEKWLQDGTLADLIESLLLEGYAEKEWVLKLIAGTVSMGGFYEGVEINQYRDEQSKTTYYLAKLPKVDTEGKKVCLRHEFTVPSSEYPNPSAFQPVQYYSEKIGATTMINASTFSSNTGYVVGCHIKDGVVIQDRDAEIYNYIMAYDDNNRFKTFPPNTRASVILNEGFTNALSGFIPLINNGVGVGQEIYNLRSVFIEPHPRTAIAQHNDGHIYFFVCEGRMQGQYGMYGEDTTRVLLSHGMKWAFMLDGGGSTTMSHMHMIQNIPSGDFGNDLRPVGNVLYIGKNEPKKAEHKMLGEVGRAIFRSNLTTNYLQRNRYQRNNYLTIGDEWLINGWKDFGTSGSSKCRAWVLPNNTLYLVGTITGGDINLPFMQLPPDVRPMFTTHHLVAGDKKDEIYKVVIGSDGSMKAYYWTTLAGQPPLQPDYIKLDGIFIPLNTPRQGIQR